MSGWFQISPKLWIALGAIFGLLIAASLIVGAMQRARPDKDYTELVRRNQSWWLMAAIFAVALLLDPIASLVFVGLVSFLALKEYLSIVPQRRADRRALLALYLAIPIQYYWVGTLWYGMFVVFVPVYMLLFIPFALLLTGQTQGFLRAVGTLHWGLMVTVFGLSHAAFVLMLGMAPTAKGPWADPQLGAALLVLLVVLTQLNDVAQYVWGKSFGRGKIAPSISPNKTWAGFLGGVATTVALACAIGPWLTPLPLVHAAILGALLAVAGFVGDLTVSAIKRDLRLKDTGRMIPGHGGILDRVDSLTYTAPLFFHYIVYFFYGAR
jgi:phosphatidate cytidylyltransferase